MKSRWESLGLVHQNQALKFCLVTSAAHMFCWKSALHPGIFYTCSHGFFFCIHLAQDFIGMFNQLFYFQFLNKCLSRVMYSKVSDAKFPVSSNELFMYLFCSIIWRHQNSFSLQQNKYITNDIANYEELTISQNKVKMHIVSHFFSNTN